MRPVVVCTHSGEDLVVTDDVVTLMRAALRYRTLLQFTAAACCF